jgi:hypothetical protein
MLRGEQDGISAEPLGSNFFWFGSGGSALVGHGSLTILPRFVFPDALTMV